VQRFVGATGDIGKMLASNNKWAYNIVKQVGNYAESFDAHLTPLGFERASTAVEQGRSDVRPTDSLILEKGLRGKKRGEFSPAPSATSWGWWPPSHSSAGTWSRTRFTTSRPEESPAVSAISRKRASPMRDRETRSYAATAPARADSWGCSTPLRSS